MLISLNEVPIQGSNGKSSKYLGKVLNQDRASKEKERGRTNVLKNPFNGHLVRDTREGTIEIKYAKSLKRLTLQRFLVTKIAREPQKVTEIDLLTLYDNLLWMQHKSDLDPNFREKHGRILQILTMYLKKVGIKDLGLIRALRMMTRAFGTPTFETFLIHPRAFLSTKEHIKGKYQAILNTGPGVPSKSLPHKRYIGVGYKDKGTAKVPHLDGSPSWQEVASSDKMRGLNDGD